MSNKIDGSGEGVRIPVEQSSKPSVQEVTKVLNVGEKPQKHGAPTIPDREDTASFSFDEDTGTTKMFTLPKEPTMYDRSGKIVMETVTLTHAEAEARGLNWDKET
ncbi:MAG: hypothetical protein COU32_00935 [Candidatus Magasanikbacteria bacterium CG10_big_fil_rev_8_21_14_0_10_42_10]|uniref:Uncharacterized protein n=2 Tax=Candidatus Magasanikiibacteriota TaxID=1752731 RepID=A0A2H0TZ25_9BACT|nr:MAG: hypothetical protein COU32_00935 [Candidatus Magasanikbacteria bacterium CG10_big_fil_rev_8_21_14_0_10_42_10]PIZ93893.1 MAG: hypothetical protein COX82_01790 [Candidatus Magasanikbacteria bacterium CG_4_10_14_0_2_um_filter_41_10]